MTVIFQTNLDEFNVALTRYAAISSKGVAEAIAKKGADFGFRLAKNLRELAPEKGSVRAERLAAIKAGGGIKIRDKIRERTMTRYGVSQTLDTRKLRMGKKLSATKRVGGKLLNLQALMVRAELNTRESGRGFSSYGSRFKSLSQQLAADRWGEKRVQILDRYNRFVSACGFRNRPEETSLLFSWGGNESSNKLAKSLQKPRQQRAIADALDATRDDIMVYLNRKQNEARAALK